MRLGFKITGLEKIKNKLNQSSKDLLEAQKQTMQEAVLLIHETAIRKINDNNDGRLEQRSNPNRVVNVSDPGDPPNTDTGRLVQSIKFDFKNNGLIGRVGTNLKYGAWLEFGTKKMAARPWLAPSVEEVTEAIGNIQSKNISKTLKGY